jgi:hypothetical protein
LGAREATRDSHGVACLEANLLRIETLTDLAQRLQRFGIALDHQDALGAARGGLKAKCSGAGKEIQNSPARKVLAKPVE